MNILIQKLTEEEARLTKELWNHQDMARKRVEQNPSLGSYDQFSDPLYLAIFQELTNIRNRLKVATQEEHTKYYNEQMRKQHDQYYEDQLAKESQGEKEARKQWHLAHEKRYHDRKIELENNERIEIITLENFYGIDPNALAEFTAIPHQLNESPINTVVTRDQGTFVCTLTGFHTYNLEAMENYCYEHKEYKQQIIQAIKDKHAKLIKELAAEKEQTLLQKKNDDTKMWVQQASVKKGYQERRRTQELKQKLLLNKET
jgi:hypothetical protein